MTFYLTAGAQERWITLRNHRRLCVSAVVIYNRKVAAPLRAFNSATLRLRGEIEKAVGQLDNWTVDSWTVGQLDNLKPGTWSASWRMEFKKV